MNTKVVAKVVILNEKGEVLLLKRSEDDSNRPGDWDFPGGEIEADEYIEVGVKRETSEEAGLAIDSLRLVSAATEKYETNSVTRLLFMSKVPDQQVVLSLEHSEYKWLDIDTALIEFNHKFWSASLRYARDNELL